MANPPPSGDDVFAQLRAPTDPAVIERREREFEERLQSQYGKAQQRQAELLLGNSTKPVTVSSVRIIGANHTRRSFLNNIVDPLLSENRQEPYTLQSLLREVGTAVDKLNRLDIFQQPISTYIDRPDQSNPSTTPTDHAIFVNLKERGKYTLKTGTEAGSSEGSAYLNLVLRNLFGGAEKLNASASLGTRTRTAYSAVFDTPVLSNPDLRWELAGLASSTLKPWASHEEVLRGGSTRLLYHPSPFSRHEFSYSAFWRQITSLAEKASPTVRTDSGDSFKSSLSHAWTRDTRDVPALPSRGYLLKTTTELAGLGPLKGDVAFLKSEIDSQASLPLPIPGLKSANESGISWTSSFRAGALCPLTPSGQQAPAQSRLNDRFILGGPTDVRGFRLAGLGPRDGGDAVGGDAYYAASTSLLFPIPRVGKETPLRLQCFLNGGRLLALQDPRGAGAGEKEGAALSQGETVQGLKQTIGALQEGLPSCAAGVGLVYAHPAARFEVNFSLPLVVRKGEEGRKGVSFGVGVSFL